MDNLKDLGVAGVLILLMIKELFGFLKALLVNRKEEKTVQTEIRSDYVNQAILEMASEMKKQTALLELCADGHRDNTSALGRLEGKLDNVIRSNGTFRH